MQLTPQNGVQVVACEGNVRETTSGPTDVLRAVSCPAEPVRHRENSVEASALHPARWCVGALAPEREPVGAGPAARWSWAAMPCLCSLSIFGISQWLYEGKGKGSGQ